MGWRDHTVGPLVVWGMNKLFMEGIGQKMQAGEFSFAFRRLAVFNRVTGKNVKPWEINGDDGTPAITEERFKALKSIYPEECTELETTFGLGQKNNLER